MLLSELPTIKPLHRSIWNCPVEEVEKTPHNSNVNMDAVTFAACEIRLKDTSGCGQCGLSLKRYSFIQSLKRYSFIYKQKKFSGLSCDHFCMMSSTYGNDFASQTISLHRLVCIFFFKDKG